MINIDLNDFIKKVQTYQSSDDALENQYYQILGKLDIWNKLSEIDVPRTKDILIFLNKWKCRLNYDCASDLAKTLQETSELLSRFNKYRLEDVKMDSLMANSDIIQEVFRRITSVQARGRTVGATATSKILNLMNPNFFMMSDDNIRHGYGCYDNELGYVNFMWRMKLFCDAVLQRFSTLRNVPMNLIFTNLVIECKSTAKYLPKLLDEYNWMKFHPQQL